MEMARETTAPAAPTALASTLRRVPLFNDLSESELELIARHITIHRYDDSSVVFAEGGACRELFLVQEGSVRILKTAASGRQQLISVERPGNSLAEIPVFDGGAYPATAQTDGPAVLLRLEAEVFRNICRQRPELALKVIKVLAHRLRRMSGLVEDLSFATVRGRLIAYLLQLARERGRATRSGLEFELAENNEELAARLGTVRELISRNLGRLHNEGLLQIRRRFVTILRPEALAAEIEHNR